MGVIGLIMLFVRGTHGGRYRVNNAIRTWDTGVIGLIMLFVRGTQAL